jgi:acyl-CoA oxidase
MTAESALVGFFSVGLVYHAGAGDPTQDLRLATKTLCLEILPNTIGRSDAFGFSDYCSVYELNECRWSR